MTLTPSLVAFALVPLILWRLYARYRRLVSRQKSRAWRHWAAVVFFPAILALLAFTSLVRPLAEVALFGGVAIGIALSVIGLRHTRFEVAPDGFWFTPDARIGIALMSLLVARVLYRFYQMSTAALPAAARGSQMQDLSRSPLTLVLIGMLLAYYTAYAIGLLRWRRAQALAAPLPGGTPP